MVARWVRGSGEETRVTRLSLVCTPIGNVGDFAPRAVGALREADVIFCEDTRHSRPLLDRVGVDFEETKLISCHAHNEADRVSVAVERLSAGQRVALITDAGAPAVSDPGGRMVAGVLEAGFDVEVMPGPSAVTAALMGAGVDASRYAFLGFLPKKGRERERLVRQPAEAGLALVFFESPQRIAATLEDLHGWLGARRVVVARELTKQFETFHRGMLGARLVPELVEKGEIVVVVESGEVGPIGEARLPIEEQLAVWLAEGTRVKQIAKQAAEMYGISTKAAYKQVLEIRGAQDD